jgi:hypothetical protein
LKNDSIFCIDRKKERGKKRGKEGESVKEKKKREREGRVERVEYWRRVAFKNE